MLLKGRSRGPFAFLEVAMGDKLVSVDEYLSTQKGAVKSGDIVLKAFRSPSSWDPKKRTARFTLSAQAEDRDRDLILQEGLDTSHFEKNPVALMFHNARSWPIGRWSDIAKNLTGRPKRTEATLNLLPEGTEPDADRAAAHIAAGTLSTCSIGFIPREVRKREVPEDKKDTYYWPGYGILSAELVEASIVPVPSLREAAVKAAGGDELALPRELIEEILDSWAKHPETGLIVPRSELEAAHKAATGHPLVVVVSKGIGPVDVKEIEEAVTKVMIKETPADEDPSTGDDHQKTADQAGAKDDAGAAKTVVLDGNQAVTDTVTGKTTTEPSSEPPEDWYGTLSGLPAEKKGSFLQWLMKLFGSNAESHLEQELRAKSAADEAEEQARKDALEARRKELQTRFQSISTRVEEKGLV
jgi:HK97 family phage prohead protease